MNSPSSWPTHTMVILRKPLHARSTRHFLVYELVIIARQNSDARYWCEIYVCLSVRQAVVFCFYVCAYYRTFFTTYGTLV